MYFNRFDICEAYWMYAANYNRSGLTERCYFNKGIFDQLTRLRFRPSVLLTEETMSDNAREIYDNLVSKWESYQVI
jgi:hypothetical protein